MAAEDLISFFSEDIEFKLDSEEKVKEWLLRIVDQELSVIEYIFCSDEYLRQINKRYLNHDYYTDIITFPLNESPLEASIYISVDRVRENAELYKVAFEDELHRVIVHGLLHLTGYNDKTDDEEKLMRLQENECLSKRSFI